MVKQVASIRPARRQGSSEAKAGKCPSVTASSYDVRLPCVPHLFMASGRLLNCCWRLGAKSRSALQAPFGFREQRLRMRGELIGCQRIMNIISLNLHPASSVKYQGPIFFGFRAQMDGVSQTNELSAVWAARFAISSSSSVCSDSKTPQTRRISCLGN
jgi:hypothetical protein